MRKIGSYTWQKGAPVYDNDLIDYFHICVNGMLRSPKWWKQEEALTDIKVTIEISEKKDKLKVGR